MICHESLELLKLDTIPIRERTGTLSFSYTSAHMDKHSFKKKCPRTFQYLEMEMHNCTTYVTVNILSTLFSSQLTSSKKNTQVTAYFTSGKKGERGLAEKLAKQTLSSGFAFVKIRTGTRPITSSFSQRSDQNSALEEASEKYEEKK